MSEEPNIFEVSSWEREMGPARGSRRGRWAFAAGSDGDYVALSVEAVKADPAG